jgi:sn-glycerol 3-phosphate transport system permease protein
MSARFTVNKVVLFMITLALAMVIVFPLWYMVVMSITPTADILANKAGLLPHTVYLGNLTQALVETPILRQMLNTVFVGLAILALQLVTSNLAAYSFAFLDFKAKNILFIIILSTMMIPDMTMIIANYLMVSSWHWLDTFQVLIVPYGASALGIFLMRQFYMTMAKEIREAAMLDGCKDLRFLLHIAVPLSRPIMAAFGVTSFLGSWSMYLWPLLVTNQNDMRMVQVGVASLQDRDSTLSVGIAIAGAAIVTIPTLLIFIFGRKQLVEGMMAGAVKG